ncbi:hypothetical protein LPJ73_007636, partial [Coemansia sp. RSA 2703]
MYAAPNRIPTASKITRDANYSSPTKQPAKIVQYNKRDKSKGLFSANDDEASVTADLAMEMPAVDNTTGNSEPRLAAATSYPVSGSGGTSANSTAAVQRGSGVWANSRLFGEDAQNAQQPQYQDQATNATSEHPLTYAWTFWFMHRMPGHKIDDYEAAMIKIASFATVESFWAVYSHLKRPDEVPTITDYHLFRQ